MHDSFFHLIHLCFRVERTREDPLTPIESQLYALPKSVPIDWFDPVYWNTVLTVRERLDYIKDGIRIALPLEEHCQTWEQCIGWKNLPEDDFMETYGNAVLGEYNMPTVEEIEQLERWEESEIDDDEVEGQLEVSDGGVEGNED